MVTIILHPMVRLIKVHSVSFLVEFHIICDPFIYRFLFLLLFTTLDSIFFLAESS